MKSAYELAMERLEKASPSISLTEDQKKEIAEVDSVYRAKIAEKEVFLKDQIRKAQSAGNLEEAESLEKQLASEIRRLQEDCEDEERKAARQFREIVKRRRGERLFILARRLTQTPHVLTSPQVASRSPRFGRSGSRKPSICARLIVRTPSCFCRSAMLWRNASIFVQCTLGRK